jgi:HPt (histidine-containing phosphotransfer) domain-containing protein
MTENNFQILNKNVMYDLVGDDEALIRKFEIEFLHQAKASIEKLSKAYKASNFNEIKEEAHFLKTSAKAVGAEQSADYLQQLEDESLNGNKEKCKTFIILINNAVKDVYGVIKNET